MLARALITGITGQDGPYIAELVLERGYKVIDPRRRTRSANLDRLGRTADRIAPVPGDLSDEGSLTYVLKEYKLGEVCNLAAQSFVQTSWTQPVLTGEITAVGVLWNPWTQ